MPETGFYRLGIVGIQNLMLKIQVSVIPAKAGIHRLPVKFTTPVMDPRLRGGDEVVDLTYVAI